MSKENQYELGYSTSLMVNLEQFKWIIQAKESGDMNNKEICRKFENKYGMKISTKTIVTYAKKNRKKLNEQYSKRRLKVGYGKEFEISEKEFEDIISFAEVEDNQSTIQNKVKEKIGVVVSVQDLKKYVDANNIERKKMNVPEIRIFWKDEKEKKKKKMRKKKRKSKRLKRLKRLKKLKRLKRLFQLGKEREFLHLKQMKLWMI